MNHPDTTKLYLFKGLILRQFLFKFDNKVFNKNEDAAWESRLVDPKLYVT